MRTIYFILFGIALASSAQSTETIEKRPFSPTQFLDNRISPSSARYESFIYALELLDSLNAKMIVETGTSRLGDTNFDGDGGSTIIFADWASKNGATLYSVDISSVAIENARQAILPYQEHVNLVCMDSIQFLRNFGAQIDFLYLDSFDFDFNNPKPSQDHHLKEIIAAYPYLHKDSIVMIDDCDLPYGGKGKLAIRFLKKHGWKVIFNGYQVILKRR